MWHYCLRVETEWLLFLTAALAAGVSVFQGDKGCIICGLMSKDVRHCLSFCARAALGDFPSSAVAQTPFAKAHTARQFLGFFFLSLAISFRVKVPVMCPDNTDSGRFREETATDALFLLLDYRFCVIVRCIGHSNVYPPFFSRLHQIHWKAC